MQTHYEHYDKLEIPYIFKAVLKKGKSQSSVGFIFCRRVMKKPENIAKSIWGLLKYLRFTDIHETSMR